VIAAVWARIGFGWPARRGVRSTAVAASVVLPAALVLWLPSGPLGADWAARAGTPASALAQTSGTTSSATPTGSSGSGASSPAPVSGFQGAVTGTVTQTAAGGGEVTVNIALDVQSSVLSQMAIQIDGNQEAGGGVAMTASSVSIGSAADPQRFTGTISSLDGTAIDARVVSSGGQQLTIALALQITTGGNATGTIRVAAAR
jgi:hypothetical protein